MSFHAPNGNQYGVPLAEIEDWQRRVRAFEVTGAYQVAELSIRGIGEPRLVKVGLVTPSFFEVLRVPPRAGRLPSAADPDEWMVLGTRLSNELASLEQSVAQQIASSVTTADRTLRVSAVMPSEFAFRPKTSRPGFQPLRSAESNWPRAKRSRGPSG